MDFIGLQVLCKVIDISLTFVSNAVARAFLRMRARGRGIPVGLLTTSAAPLIGVAIRRAVQRSGARTKYAAAAVAGSAVITKVIPMPADLSEDDLEGQVQV